MAHEMSSENSSASDVSALSFSPPTAEWSTAFTDHYIADYIEQVRTERPESYDSSIETVKAAFWPLDEQIAAHRAPVIYDLFFS